MDEDEKNNSGKTTLEVAIESSDKRIGALPSGQNGESEIQTEGMTLRQAVEKTDYQAITCWESIQTLRMRMVQLL